MRTIVCVFSLFCIAGCSTTPISVSDASPVPPSRLYGLAEKNESQLVVTRDSGTYGSAVRFTLAVDGKIVAELHPGEVAKFGISSGKHVLGLGARALYGTPDVLEYEIDVKPGETVRRRISVISGDRRLSPTAY